MSVLPARMIVLHVDAVPVEARRRVRLHGTGATDACEQPRG